MSTADAYTGRPSLFGFALILVGSWVGSAAAVDPDHRLLAGAAEPARALAQAERELKKPGEKRIRVLARGMPWNETLEMLGKETGMPVISSVVPEGKFNVFGNGREYTIPEFVDLINAQLKVNKNPCLLIRGKHEFHLIPYEPNKPIDLSVLPRVTAKELDQHGDSEVVILDLALKALAAEEVAKELTTAGLNRNMLGPLGRVLPIPGSNHLVLRDTVQTLKNIVQILDEAEEAEVKNGGVFKHKCVYVKAKEAEKVLKELLGIAPSNQPMPGQPGQPGQPVPQPIQAGNAQKKTPRVTADEASNTVFVSGSPTQVELAKKTMAELDQAKPGQLAVVTGPPTPKMYRIPGGNAPDVAKALKELYNSHSVTVSAVGKDSILVLAFPDDQEAIRKYLEGARDQQDFQAIPLYTLEAQKVYANLTTLFDVKNGPAPLLDFDAASNKILVRGTSEQVAAVKEVLKKLGEQDISGQGSVNQVVITLEKGSATALADALTLMIPQRRKNPVRVLSLRRPGLGRTKEAKDGASGGPEDGNGAAAGPTDPPVRKANSNLPGREDAPIFLSALGNKLTATCDDPDALKLVWELYRLLQTPAGEGDFEIIKLTFARAADAARTLDQAFNGTKPDSNQRVPPWFFDFRPKEKEKEPRIRVVPDSSANQLLVQANPLDMLLVHKLVKETIDVNNIDSKALIKIHMIPLQYADARDVSWTIKDLYQEHLNQALSLAKTGALRNSYFYGGLSLNTDANGNPRPVDLTVTTDDQTNTLIVACPETMFTEIKTLANTLDEAAKNSRKVWMAVPIKSIDPALIQQALDAIQGKHHNGGSGPSVRPGVGGGNKGNGSLGNSQSRGPDFFPERVTDDLQLACCDADQGGPDFFVPRVTDDPETSIFYDPQRASGATASGAPTGGSAPAAPPARQPLANFRLVKLEEQQPAPPLPTIPPGPRGPITAEALPELGVIVISATSQADLERALQLIRFIQQLGAAAEIQIQITELQHADATSVANTLTQLYQRVVASPAGTFRAPAPAGLAPGAVPRPGQPQPAPQPTQPPAGPAPMAPGAAPGAPAAPTPTQQLASVVLIPLPRVNAILWAAPRARVDDVANEIKRLDVASTPEGQTFPFPLKKASARNVADVLSRFYQSRYPGEADWQHQVRITFEATTNTVFVQASPSDLDEIRELISRIDNTVSIAVNDLRIVPLRFAVATDLANLMTQAIAAGMVTAAAPPGTVPTPPPPAGPTGAPPTGPAPAPGPTGAPPTGPAPAPGPTGAPPTGPTPTTPARPGAATKGLSLKFFPAPRAEGKGPIVTGILEDIFITPDPRTNSLIISAPEKTMELLIALVHDLDTLPSYRADIKVFQLRRADAATMAALLNQMFYGQPGVSTPPRPVQPVPSGVLGPGGRITAPITAPIQPPGGVPGAVPGGVTPPLLTLGGVTPAGAPLVPVRINVDERTNSLIVVGNPSDLEVIYAIVSRLEDTEVVTRRNEVYHLRNSSANDVALALSTFLTTALSVVAQTGQLTAYQELERDVIVIPEPITNKLLISATPSRFSEVMRLIEELDSQPPQVVIQVLIAEVDLSNQEEFGVEIGLQNPVLFRRGVGISTINTTIPTGQAGFNFNNPALPLPNNFAADPSIVGFQSLNNLGMGRVSSSNGLGGFVFSAASDTFNLLVRALKVQDRIDVLSRPQITAVDGQQAYITVGQSIPIFTGAVLTATGLAQSGVSQINVGVNLLVVPRVNPDNTVLMRVVPEVSSVLSQMVPLGNGQFGTSLNQQHLETTVLAADGETIAIGGLISKRDEKRESKIPWFGDLPYLGALFRFRTQNKTKTELLVILTPHVVRTPLERDRILAEEARRMDWILGDVVKVHGSSGLEPIFPPPGADAAGLPGVAPNPVLWPGIPCPPAPLPGVPATVPGPQETLPSPRTAPGAHRQAAPATTRQAAAGPPPALAVPAAGAPTTPTGQ